MRRSARTLTGAAVAAIILVGGAGGAQAITSNTGFDGVLNRWQQARYFQYQEKTRAGVASNVEFFTIGGAYSANVKAQNGATGTQYSEQKGLGRNIIYNIPNSTPAGQMTRLVVTNNTWSAVDVSISGWYRTN